MSCCSGCNKRRRKGKSIYCGKKNTKCWTLFGAEQATKRVAIKTNILSETINITSKQVTRSQAKLEMMDSGDGPFDGVIKILKLNTDVCLSYIPIVDDNMATGPRRLCKDKSLVNGLKIKQIISNKALESITGLDKVKCGNACWVLANRFHRQTKLGRCLRRDGPPHRDTDKIAPCLFTYLLPMETYCGGEVLFWKNSHSFNPGMQLSDDEEVLINNLKPGMRLSDDEEVLINNLKQQLD